MTRTDRYMRALMTLLVVTGVFFILFLLYADYKDSEALAQQITPATPAEITGAVGTVHTNCLISITGQTQLCLAGDGLWLSKDGGPWVQITGGAVAVAGVTSVNGKTGAVFLSATTTLQ